MHNVVDGDDEKENSKNYYACKLLQGGEHCDSGDDGGGDGAPRCRRLAEKGEKKEEVVNVEKPRRNLKRRCIDSDRRLSYSTAADLQGTSRMVDVRRYRPAIPHLHPSSLPPSRAQKRSSPLKKCPLSPPPTSSLPRMCTHYLA